MTGGFELGNANSPDGIPCPRCGEPTAPRQHDAITPKLLRQPYYYARWFVCVNPQCQTTMIMRPEDRINILGDVDPETERRMSAIEEQLRR
jgi:hypothetical protein